MDKLREGGVPLEAVFSLPDAPVRVAQGFGTAGFMSRAPHPNVARVFINWLLSKEGLETYSKGYKSVTTRNDVDESFLDPREIPRPGVKYLDSADWEYSTTGQDKINLRMKELLGRR
jgi:ABC-type Fe3+ transport system substrate-binding protein